MISHATTTTRRRAVVGRKTTALCLAGENRQPLGLAASVRLTDDDPTGVLREPGCGDRAQVRSRDALGLRPIFLRVRCLSLSGAGVLARRERAQRHGLGAGAAGGGAGVVLAYHVLLVSLGRPLLWEGRFELRFSRYMYRIGVHRGS